MMEAYEYIIVGAGLAGGVISRKLAEMGKKVLIVEKRDHMAGNTYDFQDDHGVKVQKYGPHVIHTNSDEAYDFITKFCEPVPYQTKCEAVINGVSTPSPFNFKTVDQFYSEKDALELKRRMIGYYKGRPSVTVVEMLECSDEKIRNFALFLFENDYRPYTAKQWALDPSEIDPSVLKRVPIVLSYGDTYFYDKYEFMPKDGYVELYKSITAHPNIKIKLNIDALDHITIDEKNKRFLYDSQDIKIIYTGAIDELFNYRFGILPYRALMFDFKQMETDNYQNVAIVAYPQEKGYTRVTEYTKMPFQNCNNWTCAAFEYPIPYNKESEAGGEPYYPVLTEESIYTYLKYREYSEAFRNLTLVGRLAEFKYYNMDQVVLRAIEVAENMEG